MKDLIEVFRMVELSTDTRIKLMMKLGTAINYEYASNVTEPVVLELARILDPNHPICKNEHYLRIAGELTT